MSFIYAEIYNDQFHIYADTKITCDEDRKKDWESEEQFNLVKQYGMVKNIIVRDNLVVCYAGNNVYLAAELFNEINGLSVEQIISKAFLIHFNAENVNDIEFLICYVENGKKSIVCIKENRKLNCESEYIGSDKAGQLLKNKLNEREITSEVFGKTKREMHINTYTIFREIVSGNSIEGVGGFIISIIWSEGEQSFVYSETVMCNAGFVSQIVQPGEAIDFSMNVGSGTFGLQIISDGRDIVIWIEELGHHIRYTSDVVYNKYMVGLKFPVVEKVLGETSLLIK